jgi:methyl-accepting chemotaxis protein
MNAAPLLLKKELQIKSDKNNDYNVEIFIDSNSFLNIIIKNKTLLSQYNGKYSLEELKKKNKYFLVSENISEAFYLLEPNLKNNSLIEKMNELVFTINIPNPLSPQIDFILNVEKKDYNSLLNDLREIINKQNDKINSLEQIIKDQKKDYNSLLNKHTEIINNQNDKINSLEQIIQDQKEIINKHNDKINSLEEPIKNLEKNSVKKYVWELR